MIDFSIYEQKEPKVYARKCPECGTLFHPAPMICKKCSTRRDPSGYYFSPWEEVSIEGKCKLLSWTRVYALPEGYDIKYLLFGIVELENGLRASGRLLTDNPEIGMELIARAGVVREEKGEEIYGLVFDVQ
ncbi:MAG: DNA-binding protein [Spirochaetes bacterium]|nr:MAG: DNA-binding protein [Spirochaetota bacterium]